MLEPEPAEITWDPITGVEVIYAVDREWPAEKLGRDLQRLGLVKKGESGCQG